MKKCFTSLMVLLCSTVALVSCSDDDKPVTPPTTTSIEGTYKGDKLTGNVEVDGKKTPFESASSITVKRLTDSTATVTLNDIVAGYPIYDISDVKFKVNSGNNSAELDGKFIDNAIGYQVDFDATILNEKMSAEVDLVKVTTESYTGANLAATVDGTAASNGSVSIATAGDDMAITLTDLIPGFSPCVVNAEYDITTKAMVKKFNGTQTFLDKSMTVAVEGTVEGTKLTIAVTTTPLAPANVSSFYNTVFSGKMVVNVEPIGPTETIQRIFCQAPSNSKTNFAKFEINNFSFGDLTLGDIVLDNVQCFEQNGNAIFKETGRQISVGPMPNLTLDFDGYFTKDSLYIKLLVNANPLMVNVDFAGAEVAEKVEMAFNLNDPWAKPNPDNTFEDPFGLTTSNPALSLLEAFGKVPAGTIAVEKDGDAAKINSIDTKGEFFIFTAIPKVTAGTLFNGKFEVDMMNTLNSTKFGEMCAFKPSRFSFEYKYTPGEVYYKTVINGKEVSGVEVPGVTDSCSVAAYLYEVTKETEYLTGVNINNSDKVIATAKLGNGSTQANFVQTSADFVYTAAYDPAKMYKIAIVCSSSAKGDLFEGAPGSALWIKTLTIFSEK